MTAHSPLRILAIGAHPDDIELGCAGTLARCIARGDAVTIAIACRGDSASCGLPPAELAEVRGREAREAARLLGADLIQLGLPDYGVWPCRETVAAFVEVIRQADPALIITHYHADYGGDHNNTLLSVLDATVAATVPNVTTSHPATKRVALLYMMEPLGGFGFQPQVYVDITDTFATKRKMLECHHSQLDWMGRYGGMDCREYVETVARFRGYQANVKWAEGFIPHSSWAHIPAGSPLP
jgi:LmbE family N-acetylglucosaminyl deacetylase